MAKDNDAPFDWHEIINKLAWAAVVGLLVLLSMLYRDNLRQDNEIAKLKEFNRYKTLFWNTQAQDRKAINDVIDKWNETYPDNKLPRYEWNRSDWPKPDEDN